MTNMPEKIYALKSKMDSPYTGTYCDVDDGGQCYVREDLTRQWNSNIDEAPRDGTYILLFDDGEVFTASWDHHVARSWRSHNRHYEGWFPNVWGDFYDIVDSPTHWMPLPQPPEPKEQKDG